MFSTSGTELVCGERLDKGARGYGWGSSGSLQSPLEHLFSTHTLVLIVGSGDEGWRDTCVWMYGFTWFLSNKGKMLKILLLNVKSKHRQVILYSFGWKLGFKPDTNRKKDS